MHVYVLMRFINKIKLHILHQYFIIEYVSALLRSRLNSSHHKYQCIVNVSLVIFTLLLLTWFDFTHDTEPYPAVPVVPAVVSGEDTCTVQNFTTVWLTWFSRHQFVYLIGLLGT